MSAPRFGKIQKATALVPLALLSTAWTANLAGVGGLASASDTSLPDGTQVPIEALEDPAIWSAPGQVGLGIASGDGEQIIAAASTNGIPTAALAAYQRAEQVINDADKSCHIDWALIAAIGRVESDHGRYGGNRLDADGVSTPGIYGIPLDGSNGTARISDTDAGELDDDGVFDRAVGPMQFIPSTWSVVGVDGDGDGVRNPQDIDDAALATAVYLCSGTDDLSGAISAQGQNSNGGEVAANAFDNENGTKWLDFANSNPSTRASWIQYQYASGQQFVVTNYTITSANDFPDRDPAAWRTQAQADGPAGEAEGEEQ